MLMKQIVQRRWNLIQNAISSTLPFTYHIYITHAYYAIRQPIALKLVILPFPEKEENEIVVKFVC